MFMRLAPSWDVQVFPRQQRMGPQRVLQKGEEGTISSHRLGRKVEERK